MEIDEKKRLLADLLAEVKKERGELTRLARRCRRTPAAIRTWVDPNGSWPPYETEVILWAFFGLELNGDGDIVKKEESAPQAPLPPTPPPILNGDVIAALDRAQGIIDQVRRQLLQGGELPLPHVSKEKKG